MSSPSPPPTPPVSVLSIDREEELVSLSLLPEDTGKSDVLPESLGLPLRLVGKEKKCNPEKEKNKRKLSESEQASHRLTDSHAYLFCFQTRETDCAFPVVFKRVLNVLFDSSQVSKKKKKKSKTDGNDSGVEVYFREEDDDVQNKKPQAQSVKVRIFQSVDSFPCPESGK